MRGFDRLLYLVLLIGFVSMMRGLGGGPDPTAPSPGAPSAPRSVFVPNAGARLPAATTSDSRVIVDVPDNVRSGTGTAFAISEGVWLTAAHVVEGCAEVGLYTGPNDGVWAEAVRLSPDADVALVSAALDTRSLRLRLDANALALGAPGYHIGYPQGRPGEVSSRLLGREVMVTRGRVRRREPVLAWVEVSRTRGLSGSLGGLSGGPAFAADGAAIGVTVAEAPRRGRIYTAAPASVSRALADAGAAPSANAVPAPPLTGADYARVANALRAELRVAKVFCGAAS